MLHYVADGNEISGFWLETRNKEIFCFSVLTTCQPGVTHCYCGSLRVRECMESISKGDRWNSICTSIMKLERERFRNNTKRHYHQTGVRFPAPGWISDGLTI